MGSLPFLFYPFLQELETRIETQKQTLQARDDSIKKLLEMLQSKGDGKLPIFLFNQGHQHLLEEAIKEFWSFKANFCESRKELRR